MGSPQKNTTTASVANPYPVLDYLAQLPVRVPALEWPPSAFGHTTPIVPKRHGNNHPLPDGPAEVTYYLPIANCNPTAVFFPAKYSFPAEIDIIVYFHGFKLGEFSYINEYLSGSVHNISLREDINASKKQPVLIAPTLGPRPGGADESDMGPFARDRGGDQFLAEVMRWIGKYVPQYTSRGVTPSIGAVILAGHSGAGVILQRQAFGMQTPIDEIWGFDSMYGSGITGKKDVKHFPQYSDVVMSWLSVAASRSLTKYFFHWGTSPLVDNETNLDELAKLENLSNVKVIKTEALKGQDSLAHHFAIVTSNFAKRIGEAQCL